MKDERSQEFIKKEERAGKQRRAMLDFLDRLPGSARRQMRRAQKKTTGKSEGVLSMMKRLGGRGGGL
jgi:hypothetical protein